MLNTLKFLGQLFVLLLIVSVQARASQGLVIHATEFGVGKFHRADNKAHAYGADNAWLPYVLPAGASADQVLTTHNADGSYTVFFSTLDELLKASTKIAETEKQAISVFNLNGHGIPGGMWFPKDDATRSSIECLSWRNAAAGSDDSNYDQYYSPVPADEVLNIREMAKSGSSPMFSCVSGLSAWQAAVGRNPGFKAALASNVQFHFLSCVVGLGRAGEVFTQGLAELLLQPGSGAQIQTSLNFGLGDWSIPEGMAFWDYLNDEQIERDSRVYPVNRKDREIAQKGTIRAVRAARDGFAAGLLEDQTIMKLTFEPLTQLSLSPVGFGFTDEDELSSPNIPTRLRVPGTTSYVTLKP